MMARLLILLDESGDATTPIGYQVVETEVEFLQSLPNDGAFVVRGLSLCRWAEEFCKGREYATDRIISLTYRLRALCPLLTLDEARDIHRLLEKASPSPHSLDASSILKAIAILEVLAPSPLWPEPPSKEHAARWLLWRETAEIETSLKPLVAQIAHEWADESLHTVASFYQVEDAAQAEAALAAWLGIIDSGHQRADWGDFPLSVPMRWRDRAREIWVQEPVSSRRGLFERVHALRAPYSIQEEAAKMTADYFHHHSDELTAPLLSAMEDFLSEDEVVRLRSKCPPDVPSPCPTEIRSIQDWFTQQYLPYRIWAQTYGDESARNLAQEQAAAFQSWCLRFYPVALAGGEGAEYLAMRRSRCLQQTRADWVTLWVIFDGMTFQDGRTIAKLLSNMPRLSLFSLEPMLSPLPTITQFCKRSLMEGMPSGTIEANQTVPGWDGARVLDRAKFPDQELKTASLGDVFVWPLTQPDKTYHEKMDSTSIRRDVQSELERWAKAIRDVAESVPAHLRMRIVFTTDHGRLLAEGSRVIDIPDGMEAHGRAAYGPSGRQFDAYGVSIDEKVGIAYLEKDRFRIPMDCAVVLSGNVFKTNDGKTGKEWFPHGGLSPEEVIIPWAELIRDAEPPRLRAWFSGQGRSGAAHLASLKLENLGEIAVTAVSVTLTIDTGKAIFPLENLQVGPLSSSETVVGVSRWPTKEQSSTARATVAFVQPNGFEVSVDATVDLQTQEFQSSRAARLEDI